MKRNISIIALIVMLLGVLCGCSSRVKPGSGSGDANADCYFPLKIEFDSQKSPYDGSIEYWFTGENISQDTLENAGFLVDLLDKKGRTLTTLGAPCGSTVEPSRKFSTAVYIDDTFDMWNKRDKIVAFAITKYFDDNHESCELNEPIYIPLS
ncbi:hypothetical protein DW088_01565 [Butyricicoccus sp. AM05-1]|uniref:hypothetical protein n=1 Tax=Butyricicoccus sp. AM05-1 TaxID=2292004 RepID=UPI000E47BFE0|nr:MULTISPECIES: hypothetical protein [unclassified Butyricicoccus]RHO64919.1 hypothetical protein DW088_01565 [Butyricicoccus sp. AM05-1]DAZ56568.1 MAG TPA: protein of unknown function (DUF4969) [Caudoviricetes sp.]